MPGILVHDGCDLQISNFQINLNNPGEVPPPTVRTRMDMWPYWLGEAVDAAVAAADMIPLITATETELTGRRELRVAVRAMTSAAFAVDGFYASVKSRAGEHPQQPAWRQNRTARYAQVAETLRYHLKVRTSDSTRLLRERVEEVFRFRDWAVHPSSEFKELVYRPDIDVSVDWHFVAFSATNAVAAVGKTVQLFDHMVKKLDGVDVAAELAEWKPYARKAMDHLLDEYESSGKLQAFDRAEPSTAVDTS